MLNIFPQQFFSAQNIPVQGPFQFANTAFEGLEKLATLNMQVFRTSLAENQALMGKALATKSPQEFFALSTAVTQATAEKTALYGRQVQEIVSGMQGQATTAAKTQMEHFQRHGQQFASNLSKSVPSGGVIVAG